MSTLNENDFFQNFLHENLLDISMNHKSKSALPLTVMTPTALDVRMIPTLGTI